MAPMVTVWHTYDAERRAATSCYYGCEEWAQQEFDRLKAAGADARGPFPHKVYATAEGIALALTYLPR